MQELSGPGGGQRQRRQPEIPAARRAGAWLVWWSPLMSQWVAHRGLAWELLLRGDGY